LGVLPTAVTALPAMFGSIRGATVGLMLGIRDSMLPLGERMKRCARTAGPSKYPTSNAVLASTARRIFIRQLNHRGPWDLGPVG
jgi:hypothetical protein